MGELRFFKCNVLGGFRLSDLNQQIKQGEYFFIDVHVAKTSRAVISALRDKWMIEVSEKEASKNINIPRISPPVFAALSPIALPIAPPISGEPTIST